MGGAEAPLWHRAIRTTATQRAQSIQTGTHDTESRASGMRYQTRQRIRVAALTSERGRALEQPRCCLLIRGSLMASAVLNRIARRVVVVRTRQRDLHP